MRTYMVISLSCMARKETASHTVILCLMLWKTSKPFPTVVGGGSYRASAPCAWAALPWDWRYPGRMLGQPLHKPTLLEDLQMTGKKQGTTLNWPWGQGQNSATGHKDTFWSNRGILKLDVMVLVCLIHLSKFIKCTPKSVNLTVSKLFHNKAVKTRISPGNSHLGITLCTCRTEKHTEACYVINAFSM